MSDWFEYRDPVTELRYRIGGDVVDPMVEAWDDRTDGWRPFFDAADPEEMLQTLARHVLIGDGNG